MPDFTAPITIDPHHFVDAYALTIMAPMVDVDAPPPPMTAYIVPEVSGCFISEELARQFDPGVREGEILLLTVVEQRESGSVHLYPMALPVTFARTTRPDYVQISLEHILLMFDVREYEPNPNESDEARRLDLRLRTCVAYPAGEGEQGNEAVPA